MAREGLDLFRLAHMIANRAEGVFLWARFAMEELILGHSSGEPLEEVLLRLDSIPTDLEKIYDRILGRMEPLAKKECMVMLQLVCFAKRDLLWKEHLVATDIAMGKDVVIDERNCDDKDLANTPKPYRTFVKRLRAKAIGLLELVENGRNGEHNFITPRLIHKSVSTYLDRKGWQTLGGSESINSVTHESLYVKTCARYLHCLLHQCKLDKTTDLRASEDWFIANKLGGSLQLSRYTHPFFFYAAYHVFEHTNSLERLGVSSYPLLRENLTEPLIWLHYLTQRANRNSCPCPVAYAYPKAIYMAFSHGLALYCKSDVANRVPVPGQGFWERALICALFSSREGICYDTSLAKETMSFALQNIPTVQQPHIQWFFQGALWKSSELEILKMVLQHESVKDLRLVDRKGQPVALLWLFSLHDLPLVSVSPYHMEGSYLKVLSEAAERRGEDVGQRCGPDGNLFETTLKQRRPSNDKRILLQVFREYYESKSWPFDYDSEEVEGGYGDSDPDFEDEDVDSEDDYHFDPDNLSGDKTGREVRVSTEFV